MRAPRGIAEYLEELGAAKHYDPEAASPDALVVSSDSATWLEPEVTGNPSRIGILADIPATSFSVTLQEIPAESATDLQRHPHESVHCVIEGSGYSEIGPRVVQWQAGDFVYTPPWVWHRHYSSGAGATRMLLVENSPLLETLGLAQRDSAGTIAYTDLPAGDVGGGQRVSTAGSAA
ncbi:MAG: hypothetical protein JWR63_4552 [Conexibacter sp.]|nr:hypothetical protein [Conexibacter sp.]